MTDQGADDVDYRAVPSAYAGLSVSERRTAWAVVRSLAVAAWMTFALMLVAFLVLTGCLDTFLPGGLLVVVAAGAAALSLEFAAHALDD